MKNIHQWVRQRLSTVFLTVVTLKQYRKELAEDFGYRPSLYQALDHLIFSYAVTQDVEP